MQLLALSPKKRSISRVLHQGMLEEVSRIGRPALSEQQAGCNETVQRRCQFRLPLAYQRNRQRIRKLTSNHLFAERYDRAIADVRRRSPKAAHPLVDACPDLYSFELGRCPPGVAG